MTVFKNSWRMLAVVAIGLGLCVIGAALAGDRDEQKGRQSSGKGQGKGGDVVDLNKLSPEVAKQIRALLKKRGEAKKQSISLIEAIRIVEATGKGDVERAERRLSRGETLFHVEISTGERRRTRFTLNAQGKILDSRKGDAD